MSKPVALPAGRSRSVQRGYLGGPARGRSGAGGWRGASGVKAEIAIRRQGKAGPLGQSADCLAGLA